VFKQEEEEDMTKIESSKFVHSKHSLVGLVNSKKMSDVQKNNFLRPGATFTKTFYGRN
jgi:hypothetical protein